MDPKTPTNEDAEQWVHLCIPLEYEEGNGYETPYGKDPRTVDGESFWPDRFTPGVIRSLKKASTDAGVFSAQYGQNPTPASGIVFEEKHFANRYDKLPDSGIFVMSWDMSFQEKTEGKNKKAKLDYVCGQIWLAQPARFYLVDQLHKRMDFKDTLQAFKDFTATKYGRLCRAKLVEMKANGPGIVSMVESEIPGIERINVGNDSKLTRAKAVVPYFNAANVWYPQSANAEWMHDYKQEFIKFPRGKNDDRVDATVQFLHYATSKKGLDYGAAAGKWSNVFG